MHYLNIVPVFFKIFGNPRELQTHSGRPPCPMLGRLILNRIRYSVQPLSFLLPDCCRAKASAQ